MPNTIAYLNKCPVCGEEWQELRENKRGTLYMYCERGCSLKFSGVKSRKIKASLAAGKSILEPNFAIFAQKPVSEEVQHIEKQQEKGVNINGKSGEFRGNNLDGRGNGQPAAVAGGEPVRPTGRGWFADWLADDDE